MTNVTFGPFKWNVTTGYREFMRTPEVLQLLEEAAHRIADTAGGEDAGFVVDTQTESGRRRTPRASVRTATFEAREAEARDRTLTKAIDSGRI